MVRVRAPLFSLTARGWLGAYMYARIGLVKNPYPIDLFAFKEGLIPQHASNPAFLAFYYSKKGWCYQRRRTWHGIIYAAMRPPISAQPKTPAQEANKAKFAQAVTAWQALTSLEKGVWNSYSYPKLPAGYGRFLSAYMKDKPGLIIMYPHLLQENGYYLLQEDGSSRIDLE